MLKDLDFFGTENKVYEQLKKNFVQVIEDKEKKKTLKQLNARDKPDKRRAEEQKRREREPQNVSESQPHGQRTRSRSNNK